MLIEFRTNASELHRACLRLTARAFADGVEVETLARFKLMPERLAISVSRRSVTLAANVRKSGFAVIPMPVLAGVVHMLRYFGDEVVEIGFSRGKMRVDTTIFHARRILPVHAARPDRRRSSLRRSTMQATDRQ